MTDLASYPIEGENAQVGSSKTHRVKGEQKGSYSLELQDYAPDIADGQSTDATGKDTQREHIKMPAQADLSPQVPQNSSMSNKFQALKLWWSSNVSPKLEHSSGSTGGDARDYLALERNFLSWFRASAAIASFAVVITQLFIFRQLDTTQGVVLGCLISGGGIVFGIFGCVRFFRQQKRLVQGKVITGGWDTVVIITLLLLLLITLFVIVMIEA